jgi:hypothetical protein
MKFEVVKKGIYLIPFGSSDKEKFAKIGQGEICTIDFKKNRNYLFHKKFFSLLNIGFENQDKEDNFDFYRAKVLIAIGHCDTIALDNGTFTFIPKSISYDAIPDNNDFETVYNRAVSYIANKLCMTNEELSIEILSNF